MAAVNEYLGDEELWNAIEDVTHFICNEGSEVVPPVIKEKIVKIIAATKRNDRVHSIELGTAGKGGVVKVYVDPLDMDTSETILQNIYVLRSTMQEMHKTEDINPMKK